MSKFTYLFSKFWFSRIIIFLLLISFVFHLNFLYIDNAIAFTSRDTNHHIYTCDGIDSKAVEGVDKMGRFDNDFAAFSISDCNKIGSDDNDFVYDSSDIGTHQYHKFDFYIDEDVSDILSLNITWKGYGGNRKESLVKYGYSLWVKENNQYVELDDGTSSSKDTLVKNYGGNRIGDIDNIIHNNHLYIAAQSDYYGVPEQDDPPSENISSWIETYYIEVDICCFDSDSEAGSFSVSYPDSVVEGESFQVTVVDNQSGNPVEGADISFGSSNDITDSSGIATIDAPSVDLDVDYSLSVSKDGYETFTSSILVQNDVSGEEDPVLEISNIDSVVENNDFIVTVTSDDLAVIGALVVFNGKATYTDESGIVSLNAPPVNKDTTYSLSASAPGYTSAESSITVLDNNSSHDHSILSVSAPSNTLEDESFTVTVTSDSIPVSRVNVSFAGEISLTDVEGMVSFVAPAVDSKTDFEIVASKQSFVSDSATISIFDSSTTDIILSYPVGGETLNGVVDIFFSVVNPPAVNIADPDLDAGISIYYSQIDGSWIEIVDDLGISADSYKWDTTEVSDGSYLLKVVLKFNGETYTAETKNFFNVNNEIEVVRDSWISGKVTDNTSYEPVRNVEICLKLSENPSVYKCVFTNELGIYNLSAEPGDYSIRARKKGYEASIIKVRIYEKKSIQNNFIIEKIKIDNVNFSDNSELFFNSIIKDSSFDNIAGAKVDADKSEIAVFTNNLNITIENQNLNNLKIKVSAPNNTNSKIIFIKAGNKTFKNVKTLDDFKIIYDGKTIQRESIDYLLTKVDSNVSKPAWTVFSSFDKDEKETYYFAVLVPSFSEHKISISATVEEILGGVTALIYNIFFILISAFVIGGITFYRMKH